MSISAQRYPDAITLNGRPHSAKRAAVDFSIYMARSTPWIPPGELAALRPGKHPYVVLLPAATPLPGWLHLEDIELGKDTWYGYVLPAR